jgi:hypothetical protein
VDTERRDIDEPLVLLLEPGTGSALEIPFTFAKFHEQLSELREPALASSYFAEWSRANPNHIPLRSDQCVGYKIPLFLNGTDSIENLEAIDIDVYWTLSAELLASTQNLPPGTPITRVNRGQE